MSRYIVGTPMDGVRRIHTHRGSHIEPELDPTWTPLDQLRWLAAVVHDDSGLTLTLAHFTDHDTYGITGHGHSLGAVPFDQAWATLSDLNLGAQMAATLCPAQP